MNKFFAFHVMINGKPGMFEFIKLSLNSDERGHFVLIVILDLAFFIGIYNQQQKGEMK